MFEKNGQCKSKCASRGALAIILIAVSVMALKAPVTVWYVRSQFRTSMSNSEFERVIKSLPDRMVSCQAFGDHGATLMIHKTLCQNTVSSMMTSDEYHSVRFYICETGPLFIKNDFTIDIAKDGTIESISMVKSWD